SMSNTPYMLPRARWGYRMGDAELVDGMMRDGFLCPLADEMMGATAETLAERYAITREEQDAYAVETQRRAGVAYAEGRFDADIDLIELNEAFAAQVLACDRELHLDRSKLNVHGGAISLGHPIGCTGARIVTTLLHALQSRGGRYGLATLCISGGMGLSMIVERT